MCSSSWYISMRKCNCTVNGPARRCWGFFSLEIFVYLHKLISTAGSQVDRPIREKSWCFVCLVHPWMFLNVFYASAPPTLNHCITQWLHAEGIVEQAICFETSKRLINLIVMLASCVLFDQTYCWVDSGDQWIIDCKCATFIECKKHCRGWREELWVLKYTRRYKSVSAMHSGFVLKKNIKRYAYTKNDNVEREN